MTAGIRVTVARVVELAGHQASDMIRHAGAHTLAEWPCPRPGW